MARLSKSASNRHDDALALLSLSRSLKPSEIENVYDWYSPMASHDVGKNAVFFTPGELAQDFAQCAAMSEGGMDYLDACAGIGRLTYEVMASNRYQNKPSRYVCFELNSEFVEAGKKLLPDAEWVCGNIFDIELLRGLGEFSRGFSNPPFGNIKTKGVGDWLSFQGAADLMVAEVLVRLCRYGAAMIVSSSSAVYDNHGKPTKSKLPAKWENKLSGYQILVSRPSLDMDCYKDLWEGTSPSVAGIEVGEDAYVLGALGLPKQKASPMQLL